MAGIDGVGSGRSSGRRKNMMIKICWIRTLKIIKLNKITSQSWNYYEAKL